MNGKNRKNAIDLKNNLVNGDHSYLLEYYNAVQDGQIIIGHELQMELDLLIEDLEDNTYDYDIYDADLRIDFIETFCRHTKSPFYGVPFILELWEKAVVEAFYSFKDWETGLRRFKKCILLVARKNGKSTLCAALALTELTINVGGIDIVISSNDDNQASIIFEETNNMREQFDPNERRTHKNLKGMFNTKNKSTIKKLSDRTKNKEGRNIDYAYIDETHEMKTNVIAKSIEQSTSTKDEPGIWEITTEGFINDGYLDKTLVYARKVLRGVIEDPTLLVWLYTQDSETEVWQDEKTWSKSNPSLGVIKKYSYLRDQIRKAQIAKEDRVFCLAKDFNIKQNNAEAWLMEEEYINIETYELERFRGKIALGGVDLSETTDLTCAKAMIMLPGDNKKYFITKYFIPEAKVIAGEEEDKKNYLEWAKLGLLQICPGNENDFSYVTKWFIDLYKTYGIKFLKIGYDKWMAKYWVKEMEDVGFDMERVNMDKKTLSDPMKLLGQDLRNKLVVYNNNPIDAWCLGNTALKIDSLGLIMPIKVEDQRTRRIDGTLSKIIAYVIYNNYKTDYLSMVR